MVERNLQTETNNRIKAAVLSKWGRPHSDCTDVKVDGRTWEYGIDFINGDGSHVYNGVSFNVLDTKLLNKEPIFNPDIVYKARYKNPTTDEQTFNPTLSKSVTVTDQTTLTFQTSIKFGVKQNVSAKFLGVGVSAEFSTEAGFSTGKTTQTGKSQTITQSQLVPIVVKPGKSKILSILSKISVTDVPFEMVIEVGGHIFFWAWWDNAGGRRWAGWPDAQDWKNPFCGSVDDFFSNDDDVNTGKRWKFGGVFKKVTYLNLDVQVEDGPDVPIKDDAVSIEEEIIVDHTNI